MQLLKWILALLTGLMSLAYSYERGVGNRNDSMHEQLMEAINKGKDRPIGSTYGEIVPFN